MSLKLDKWSNFSRVAAMWEFMLGAVAAVSVGALLVVTFLLKRDLRRLAGQLEAVFKNSPYPIVVNRLEDGAFLRVNEAFCRENQITEEEVTRAPLTQQLPPHLWAGFERVRSRLLNSGAIHNQEVRTLLPNGMQRDQIVSSTLIDWNGVRCSLTMTVDISERRAAERERAEVQARYQRLYQGLIDGFAAVDLNGRFTDANWAFQEMVGYNEEELKQKTVLDLTPSKWIEFEQRLVREQASVRGFTDPYEKEYRCKDGTLVQVELRVHLERDEQGHPVGYWCLVRPCKERRLTLHS
ncbi:MAG: PAS domain-containing protein [Opitutaceae bacterium]|nr:PAS domain-containing protein [Opitutaceae bacterium]